MKSLKAVLFQRNSKIYVPVCSLDRDGEGRSPFVITVTWYYVRMKKMLFIALVLLVKVGCSETEVDTPSFADGQATALTIEAICDGLGYDFAMQEGSPLPLSEFTEEYQGLGVWLVQLVIKNDYKWNVYESTGTVTTAGTYETYMKYGTSRTATRHIC